MRITFSVAPPVKAHEVSFYDEANAVRFDPLKAADVRVFKDSSGKDSGEIRIAGIEVTHHGSPSVELQIVARHDEDTYRVVEAIEEATRGLISGPVGHNKLLQSGGGIGGSYTKLNLSPANHYEYSKQPSGEEIRDFALTALETLATARLISREDLSASQALIARSFLVANQ